ncbi:MAG: aldo/keto reductase [Clostridia bacterium]|jgi:myo-inositol catabolism protein IolS|nr:aldo/keto reductase [Lachnospiraceae bacterium]NCC01147.1 aldo/keto reductase [Clostridia bacterium]NCD03045.1 aldo/keto reductase [Clostridia bacterium]
MGLNKKMPKIAMGAWAWGNDGTFGDHYEASDLKAVYETAMENGLNLWDTAFVYGMGTSEKILGELTKDTSAENLILSTKFTPQCDDGSSEPMLHMLEGSLKNLHVDAIDIWWIHNPMDVEKYTPMLIPLAQKGLIKEIGVSNHSLVEIKRANEILGAAGLKISAVQNHYSLLNRSSEESGILDYCKENGITFYAYMVLEQGALSGKYDTAHLFPKGSARAETYNPMMAEIEKLTDVLKEVGDAHGISGAQTAIAWAIEKGTLPIVGVTKVHHVEDAAKAASVTLSEAEIALMEKTANDLGLSTIRFWEKKME